MSVRFDAEEPYTSTAAPPDAVWTVALWVKIAVDRNALASFFSVDDGSSGFTALRTAVDGVTLTPYSQLSAGGASTQLGLGFAMTVGTWHPLALVVNGADTATYWADATGAAFQGAGNFVQAHSRTTIRIGGDRVAGEWLNGNVANVKLWNAALTAGEVLAEWASWDAIRTANLIRHHKFKDAAETTDYSGNGNTLTATGSPTFDADNPPISDNSSSAGFLPILLLASGPTAGGGGGTTPTGGSFPTTFSATF